MLKVHYFVVMILSALVTTVAFAGDAEPIVMKVWPGDLPNVVKDAGEETLDLRGSASNVAVPEMSVYLPTKESAAGLAMIVCPGGSYREIGYYTTGMGTVDYYVPKGIAIIVLKYRTRPPSKNVMADALADAKRAVRLVRYHASEWDIDPDRIGMLGSSAGSHLILNLATHWDAGDADAADPVEQQSCRPDFVAVLCPWPGGQAMEAFPVTSDSPPAFLCSAHDDTVAPTSFAESIHAAYQHANVPSELWTVQKGGHRAFTMGGRGEGAKWVDQLWSWLEEIDMWQGN